MFNRPSGKGHPIRAMLLGLLVTGAVAAGHFLGLFDRLERQTLDVRFRVCPNVTLTDQIVHVDIDDRSLEELGRWPWPREDQAGLVQVLNDSGARFVVLDIILPDPQPLRYESAAEEIYAPGGELLGSGPPRRIFDDAQLARTLEQCAQVALPMHIDFAEAPDADNREALLTECVDQVLAETPEASLEDVRSALAATAAGEANEPELTRLYLRCRALRALDRFALPAEDLRGYPLRRGRMVPPLVIFAQAADTSGFVTFRPDADGIVRRIRLLAADQRGRIFPQFALALAVTEVQQQSGRPIRIDSGPDGLVLRAGDQTVRRIPTDDQGCMLINWAPTDRTGRPPAVHLSAAGIEQIHHLRKELDQLRDRKRILQLALARRLGQSHLLELFAEADRLYRRRVAWQVQRQQTLLFDPGRAPQPLPEALRQAESRIEQQIEQASRELFDDFYLQGASAQDKAEILALRNRITALPEQAEAIRRRTDGGLRRLRKHVAGKVCLIGSTATGAADFVPTPVHERAAGVVVHGNIVNTILQGAFIRRTRALADLLTIFLLGAAASYLVATRPLFWSAPGTALLAGVFVVGNAWGLFGQGRIWLVLVAPLVAMAGSFAVVTAYRQLTEERAKRRIRGLFAHALSPALVDRLIEDPSLARLGGERRVLTLLFSDLQEFTRLAEALGEAQTVRLLNHYFDHMTEVLQNRWGAYLNKFLGDGLLVFFGAPVFQDDHAARAIEAALDAQAELGRLNRELTEQYQPPVKLTCRMGIATGEVMVGNCGSTQRMDYTAIGDTVNIASRLEAANKFFGTRILAAEQTWRQRRGDVLARPLGRIRVVGRDEPVDVWNVLARAADATDEMRIACDEFARAIRRFAERQFGSAAELFAARVEGDPHDTAARVYLTLCRRYQQEPPAADWSGAVELTEK